ncbi:MAG: glutamate-1-semialdehyde-2,1-aminomutase [Bacteroidetes bacterium]|nr:MAG: glutamate-1-semialdehyde-2,1-aminomutase [Bacteroidota bacterium]
MNHNNSIQEFQRAKNSIPGGVNSPARAFRSVGGNPVFIAKAKGSRMWDIDGNEYIDYVSSWGPMIVGHADDRVIEAITDAAQRGTSYGAPTIGETNMAEMIKKMKPSMEIVRMVNSGTEATMSALRLARGYTGRDKFIKFEGCYHGHADSFLIKAGSGALTLGLPDSPGVTKGTAADTLTAKYNDLEGVAKLFESYGSDIAAVILEPVVGNMGVVIPDKEFLEGLRGLTQKYGALLIFDEVMTGFRLAKGGAQEYFGITPDITCLGKIIGGGLPVGAYGGPKEIMEHLAPAGPIYQAGTLSGNPLAMAAGLATLKIIDETPGFHDNLEAKSAKLEAGLRENLKQTGHKGVINRVGSMITLFFTEREQVKSFDDASTSDTEKFGKYFRAMLEQGIYLPPSQYEAAFIPASITDEEIEKTIEASLQALKML